jgi:6-phosphogluconolactonase
MLTNQIKDWDVRRQIIVAGSLEQTIEMAADHWAHSAQRAIQQHGKFIVALSGGSTPKAIYQKIISKYNDEIDWTKIYLFWSDERAVSPDDAESNYKMAMDSGFKDLPIPRHQIFRMHGEGNIQQHAEEYEKKIDELFKAKLTHHFFDLVMLGVGEDGHTASLFPNTDAIHEKSKLVVANHLPEKNTWRMTLTFPCINQSDRAVIYAVGKNKESIVPLVLQAPITSSFPASAIGTDIHPALWILDSDAARLLSKTPD